MKQLCLSLAVFTSLTHAQTPGAGPRRPPPEALAACEGKAADAACSFTHDGRTMNGTCFTPAGDKPLACRPAGPPPQGR